MVVTQLKNQPTFARMLGVMVEVGTDGEGKKLSKGFTTMVTTTCGITFTTNIYRY